jgi:hypothetical protein
MAATHGSERRQTEQRMHTSYGRIYASGWGHKSNARTRLNQVLNLSGCNLLDSNLQSGWNHTTVDFTVEGSPDQLAIFQRVMSR